MVKISKWVIPQILIFLILGLKKSVFLAFFFIIIHEFAHYIVSRRLGVGMKEFKIGPLGASMELNDLDEANMKEQIIICISGPLINLSLAIFFYYFNNLYSFEVLKACYEVNLVLGIFNLLPAYPLDGARIVRSILSERLLYKRAHIITSYISYFVGIVFLGVFLGLLYIHKLNISLLICFIFIMHLTRKEKERVMYIIMSDIFKKRRRFFKNKSIQNKSISVYYKETLVSVFGMLDKNKFNFFVVLNDDMKVIGNLYEDEIIEALKVYGNISLKEYLCLKHKTN
jgi:stage IV sporulation protein FB